jgi:hypothetical protein
MWISWDKTFLRLTKISSYNITSKIYIRVNLSLHTLEKLLYNHVTKTALLWPFQPTRHPIKKIGNFRKNCVSNAVRTSHFATKLQGRSTQYCTKKNSAILQCVFEHSSYITIMYFQNNFEQKASCALQNTKILSNLNLPATSPLTSNTTIQTQLNRLPTPSLASGNLWNNSPLSISDISIVCMCFTKSEVVAI